MFDRTNVIIQGNKAEEILRQKIGGNEHFSCILCFHD